jgi:hypothetical protein
VALLLFSMASADGATIPKPADARSWILVHGSDCDDDGQSAHVDRGHCIGEVSDLDTPGDLGHGQWGPTLEILGAATIGPEMIRGSFQTTATAFAWFDMSMVDTYTLNSSTLPPGTVVPVTVSFHAVGTMYPDFVCCGAYGSGVVEIKVGSSYNMDPLVDLESYRVGNVQASDVLLFEYPRFSSAPVPVDLQASHTMDVEVGTPFDLAYYLGARPFKSTIDLSNTATISFSVPEGTQITSTGGFGSPVPVVPSTWGGLKSRFGQ